VTTGKKPASDSGRLLGNPKTPKKVKEISASDLAQAKHRKPLPTPLGKKKK
jgi:hypothetical protein